MAEVKLSMEEYHNVVKSLNTRIEKLYEMTKNCSDYKRQRDELINDMAEVKRKAEAWDKLKEEKTKEYVLRHNQLKQTSILDPRELSIREMVWELKYDLQRMDELDDTNDFQNLLSDLEEQ